MATLDADVHDADAPPSAHGLCPAHLAHARWVALGDSAGWAGSMIGSSLSCAHGLCPLRWTSSDVAA